MCDAELEDLLSLVAKSLVRQTEAAGGEPRYWMLETIREFAACGARAVRARRRGSANGISIASRRSRARRARELVGPRSTEWYGRLDRDLENLRAAFGRALERSPDAAVALAVALAPLHLLRGRYGEAEDMILKALELEPARLGRGSTSAAPRPRAPPARPAGRGARVPSRGGAAARSRCGERDETWWAAWIDVKLEQAHHYYFQGDLEALAALVEFVRPQVERHGDAVARARASWSVLAQHAYRRERYVLSEETEA